jgi:hypothetical protein
MPILIGLANVVLYCAIVVFVAFTLLWLLGLVGYPPSAEMVKVGKIIVLLLCLIAVMLWLASLFGLGGGFPNYFFGARCGVGLQC